METSLTSRSYLVKSKNPLLWPDDITGHRDHTCTYICSSRPTKYKTVVGREEKLRKAFDSVVEHGMPIRRAALEYGLPVLTE